MLALCVSFPHLSDRNSNISLTGNTLEKTKIWTKFILLMMCGPGQHTVLMSDVPVSGYELI